MKNTIGTVSMSRPERIRGGLSGKHLAHIKEQTNGFINCLAQWPTILVKSLLFREQLKTNQY